MRTERQKLEDKLDDIVRNIVRARDFAGDQWCKCVTCDKSFKWGDWNRFNAGHFQVRRHRATRWLLKNVNMQCVSCNNFGKGEQFKHGAEIDKKYGKGTSERIENLARTTVKLSISDLKSMLEDLKRKYLEYTQTIGNFHK